MSHFLWHQRDTARGEFREVRKLLGILKECDAGTQCAVGYGVHLANADFIRHFASIECFRRVTAEQQKQFCGELSDLELRLRNRHMGLALGVGLYRIWLADLLAGRHNVTELLGPELTELSRKGFTAGW